MYCILFKAIDKHLGALYSKMHVCVCVHCILFMAIDKYLGALYSKMRVCVCVCVCVCTVYCLWLLTSTLVPNTGKCMCLCM